MEAGEESDLPDREMAEEGKARVRKRREGSLEEGPAKDLSRKCEMHRYPQETKEAEMPSFAPGRPVVAPGVPHAGKGEGVHQDAAVKTWSPFFALQRISMCASGNVRASIRRKPAAYRGSVSR